MPGSWEGVQQLQEPEVRLLAVLFCALGVLRYCLLQNSAPPLCAKLSPYFFMHGSARQSEPTVPYTLEKQVNRCKFCA